MLLLPGRRPSGLSASSCCSEAAALARTSAMSATQPCWISLQAVCLSMTGQGSNRYMGAHGQRATALQLQQEAMYVKQLLYLGRVTNS
jgi:hypothetical protein